MSFQEDETLRLYVEESLEHLSNIENDLLAIESAGADINEELVNKVFRAAHSIKGGAGFMGLDNIKELSHKMENVLGMIREREMIPNPEIVNILLLASDTLRNLLKNVGESNQMDISEHVEALGGLTSNLLPKQRKKDLSNHVDIFLENGRTLFTVSKTDISNARNKGYFIYVVEVDLIRDAHEKGMTPMDFLAKIQESGNVFDCKLDVDSVGTLERDTMFKRIPFTMLLGTILEPSMVNALFDDIDETSIFEIKEDFTLQPVGQPKSDDSNIDGEFSDAAIRRQNHEFEMDPVQNNTVEQLDDNKKADIQGGAASGETSLRVHVKLLDSLMNLAGELVLGRNQLLQAIALKDIHSVDASGQRLDLITSELQEAIMMTRMQPIGNIFNKFPRVVRDLSRSLGKEVRLTIEGESVELDKTILEAISDPLTHLIRNAVDHGIEMPSYRSKAGKNSTGHVMLKAYHEAGQVNVEIKDDGRGIDSQKLVASAMAKNLITEKQASIMSEKEKSNLVFLPGLSTAERVSDVSGRGVGMDVVKTNLDKLGGIVDIDSRAGEGTIVKIKLPLTLAIIPSQLIKVQGERYAIPQVNLEELFRIPAGQVKTRIEKVGDAEVVRLRDNLLPLIRLADVIGIERTYLDSENNETQKDRRINIADRRSRKSTLFKDESFRRSEDQSVKEGSQERDLAGGRGEDDYDDENKRKRRSDFDRRYHANSAVNIVVVYTGALKYGLVVDALQDSEEIVVKPLGRHIKHCKGYAGATIMGDGRVALILDVAGISQMAGLNSVEGTDRAKEIAQENRANQNKDIQSMLIFRNAEEEQFAVPLGLVERIEKIKGNQIENVGGKRVMQYRGATLPLIAIEQVAEVKPLAEKEEYLVIVFIIAGHEVGLLATPPLDAIEKSIIIDDSTFKQAGIMGSAIIDGRTTLIINIFGIVETINPTWFEKRDAVCVSEGKAATVLYAEDSNFFRSQIKDYLIEAGYTVLEAEDGLIAWDLLQQHEKEISLVIADIEMPNLDGFGLTQKIRADKRFSHLPIIALTTMAGDEDIRKGKELGINDYQIKLDKEKLLKSVHDFLSRNIGKIK